MYLCEDREGIEKIPGLSKSWNFPFFNINLRILELWIVRRYYQNLTFLQSIFFQNFGTLNSSTKKISFSDVWEVWKIKNPSMTIQIFQNLRRRFGSKIKIVKTTKFRSILLWGTLNLFLLKKKFHEFPIFPVNCKMFNCSIVLGSGSPLTNNLFIRKGK